MNKLKNKADLRIDNNRRVEIFITVLIPQLRHSCAQYRRESYGDVVNHARDHETILPDPEEVEVNAISPQDTRNPDLLAKVRCYYCKEEGHMKGTCRRWLDIVSSMECYKC